MKGSDNSQLLRDRTKDVQEFLIPMTKILQEENIILCCLLFRHDDDEENIQVEGFGNISLHELLPYMSDMIKNLQRENN